MAEGITHTTCPSHVMSFSARFSLPFPVPKLFPLHFICCFSILGFFLLLFPPLFSFLFLPIHLFFLFYILPCISPLTCFPNRLLYIWLPLSPSIPLMGDKDTLPLLFLPLLLPFLSFASLSISQS